MSPTVPDSTAPALRVRGLVKRYGATAAVTDVALTVARGEIFGLLGANGAGKTSTIECVLGLRDPDAGEIEVAGIDARAQPAAARAVVGAQLQAAALQDKLTARQALGLFGAFYARARPVGELLERFGLQEKADAAFDTLSGGQRQRLFLALAFVNDPWLVVLDEPTAGLDPATRRELHELIRGVRAAGRAVLLSTHYIQEAETLCDRVGLLDRGRMIAEATPAALIAQARAHSRVLVRSEPELTSGQVRGLAGVVAAEPQRGGWLLGTREVNATVSAAVQAIAAAGGELRDLQIRRPSLEDVLLERTGRAWADADEEGGEGP